VFSGYPFMPQKNLGWHICKTEKPKLKINDNLPKMTKVFVDIKGCQRQQNPLCTSSPWSAIHFAGLSSDFFFKMAKSVANNRVPYMYQNEILLLAECGIHTLC